MHVHVQAQNGAAKFWLDPVIAVAQHTGLSHSDLNKALRLVQEHENEIREAWNRHFNS